MRKQRKRKIIVNMVIVLVVLISSGLLYRYREYVIKIVKLILNMK